jgi:outer membrane protein OmpA-like peptidoglycan-associated protein
MTSNESRLGIRSTEDTDMQKITWTIIVIALAAAASPADAAGASKEEKIGVGAGGVVGAVAGGPVGFIIGAAIGAKLGDTFHERNEKIESLTASLDMSTARVVALEKDVETAGRQLVALQGRSMPELVELLEAGISMDLLFRTDEHALIEQTQGRLTELASQLATLPAVRIRLDGFADERGDSDYNQALSEKRVAYVREVFVAAGVAPDRISQAAHGESEAADDRPDSFALERRVSVELSVDDVQAFASNPD